MPSLDERKEKKIADLPEKDRERGRERKRERERERQKTICIKNKLMMSYIQRCQLWGIPFTFHTVIPLEANWPIGKATVKAKFGEFNTRSSGGPQGHQVKVEGHLVYRDDLQFWWIRFVLLLFCSLCAAAAAAENERENPQSEIWFISKTTSGWT
jgi:hypothetical protein